MSSLKQTIYDALYKIATPGGHEVVYDTPEESRDAFIGLVMAELFPAETKPEPKKTKAAPKKAKEEAKEEVVVPMLPPSPKKAKAKAKEEPKPEPKVEPKVSPKKGKKAEPKPEPKPEPKVEESPKKKGRGPMTDEAKAAMAAKRAATIAAKKTGGVETLTEQLAQMTLEPPVAAAKPKKGKEESNLAKIDPTWRKALKEADKDGAKEHEPELLAFLNAMSKEAFHGKGSKEHVAAFLASRVEPVAATVPADLSVVEFKGKDYYVNEETKRVYEGVMGEDGTLTVTRPVGYVGMADFKDMTLE